MPAYIAVIDVLEIDNTTNSEENLNSTSISLINFQIKWSTIKDIRIREAFVLYTLDMQQQQINAISPIRPLRTICMVSIYFTGIVKNGVYNNLNKRDSLTPITIFDTIGKS